MNGQKSLSLAETEIPRGKMKKQWVSLQYLQNVLETGSKAEREMATGEYSIEFLEDDEDG